MPSAYPRSQQQRRAATVRLLLAAARRCFAERGYTATGTPEICAAAGMTRGALYHHFPDKAALFAAVVDEEQALLAMQLEGAAEREDDLGPVKALVAAGEAFHSAMQEPGRRRILLVDAPAVLGRPALDVSDERHGFRILLGLVNAAIDSKSIRAVPATPLARLLQSLFERAAL